MHESIRDPRSGKVIFVSHCYLNQNAKVRGIAQYRGIHIPLLEIIIETGAGIVQMPCPEMTYLGTMRWGQVKEQYNTPMFKRHCHSLARIVSDEAEDYTRSGYKILGFIMADGSPVCGLNKIPHPAGDVDQWGGMVWYLPKQQFIKGRGVFYEILLDEVRVRGLSEIPFLTIPEVEEAGSMADALTRIRETLLSESA